MRNKNEQKLCVVKCDRRQTEYKESEKELEQNRYETKKKSNSNQIKMNELFICINI